MRRVVEFTVYGKAEPAGSKTAFVVKGTNRAIVTDANKKSKPWQAEVRSAAIAAVELQCEPDRQLLEGPLELRVVFWLPRPKTVKRQYPTVKPDTTKLLRGLEDAMTGTVYQDDAQIVIQGASKLYSERPRVDVVVRELT